MPDYKIEAGEYLPMEAWVKVPEVADPLDGAEFFFSLKRSPSDPDSSALIRKRTDDETIIHVPPNKARWTLTTPETAGISESDYNKKLYWDCRYKTITGQVKTIDDGFLTVTRPITQDTG